VLSNLPCVSYIKLRMALLAIVVLTQAIIVVLPYAAEDSVIKGFVLPLTPLKLSHLRVTSGAIRESPMGLLVVESPSMRAEATMPTSDQAELRFLYLGPTTEVAPLASGELRRQVGLKLRAQDTCNVLYVMWHIEPDQRLAVSVKRNPGKSLHSQCGDRGYTNLQPRTARPLPSLEVGSTHALRAAMREDRLVVFIDQQWVWEGPLSEQALSLHGPVGLRSDNVRFDFELFIAEPLR